MRSSTEHISRENVGVQSCCDMFMLAKFCVIAATVFIFNPPDVYRVNDCGNLRVVSLW